MVMVPIALTCVGAAGYLAWDAYAGIGRKLRTLWRAGGLYNRDGTMPELRERRKTAYGYCLRLSLPPGLCAEDFERRREAIEQFLGHKVRVNYNNKNLFLEVYEGDLKAHDFEAVKLSGMRLVIGHTYGSKLVTVDLDREPHLMIAGETGSGKSTAFRAILTNLFLTKPRVKVHLIDLKQGTEFALFAKCGKVVSFARDVDQAAVVLNKVYQEVERRYRLFADHDSVDITEYNAQHKPKLSREIVAIDEFAMLRDHKSAGGTMEDLAALARACGIHLIISTQRPDARVITGRVKVNIPVVLGLKTLNDMNSRIIIDEGGLQDLRGRGHGWLRYMGELTELHTMNLPPQRARDLLKPLYRENPALAPPDTSGTVEDFDFLEG
jgi:S-DNA-T family DNA segregation ATPase FtsK/SpoIIIE